jgi:hypothetical protein
MLMGVSCPQCRRDVSGVRDHLCKALRSERAARVAARKPELDRKRARAHLCKWCGRVPQASCSDHVGIFINAIREVLGKEPIPGLASL